MSTGGKAPRRQACTNVPDVMTRIASRDKDTSEAIITAGRDILLPFTDTRVKSNPHTVSITPYSLDVFDVIWVDHTINKYAKCVYVYTHGELWPNDERMIDGNASDSPDLPHDITLAYGNHCNTQILYDWDICPHLPPIPDGSTIMGKLCTVHGEVHTFVVDQDGEMSHCIMDRNSQIHIQRAPVNLCQFLYCEYHKCILAQQRLGDRMNLWMYYVDCVAIQRNTWRCVFRTTLHSCDQVNLVAVLRKRYVIFVGSSTKLRVFDLDTRLYLFFYSQVLRRVPMPSHEPLNVIHRSEYRIHKLLDGLAKVWRVRKPVPISILQLIQMWWGIKGTLCLFHNGWYTGATKNEVSENELCDEIRARDWRDAFE